MTLKPPTNLYGQCPYCNLLPTECPHRWNGQCWVHEQTFLECAAANLHCIPPRGGEAEEEFEDVPKVAPPTPTYTVEDLIAQIRSKNVPITRWVSRKWSGEISFDQRHHNYHCRPVRFRDDHFDQWYRGESLDAIIAKLRSVSKFSEGFRLLEEGEQPAARPKGAPRIVDRKMLLKLRAAGLTGPEIMKLTGIGRTSVYSLSKPAAKDAQPKDSRDFGYLGEPADTAPRKAPKRPLSAKQRERREQLFGDRDPVAEARANLQRERREEAAVPESIDTKPRSTS